MNCKTIIFDLDGTLLDTVQDLANAVNHSMTLNGFNARTLAEIRSFIGNGIRKLVERSMPQGDTSMLDKCVQDFYEYYTQNMTVCTKPYEGVVDMLGEIKEQGIKICVLSNKEHNAACEIVKKYFGNIFDVVFGERKGVPIKPDPSSTIELLSIMQAQPDEVLYIGDSDVDMKTAKAANVFAVGVTWGFKSREVLMENGADILIDCPKELLKLLKN